jgi:sodium-dependent phosphate cotransporter
VHFSAQWLNFLPLEIAFSLLERLSAWIISIFRLSGSVSEGGFNPIKMITEPLSDMFSLMVSGLSAFYAGIVLVLIGVSLIVLCISFMGKTMKLLMVGKANDRVHSALGKGPITGIASGTLVTVLVQSSSTTTSLIVPLVGNGIVKMREVYPFTLGANIGTCITALIAALSVTGENAHFALQIAIVHLFYNVLDVLVIYGIPLLRELPPTMSSLLAAKVAEHKILGLVYIVLLFFLLPLIALKITS